MMPSAYYEILAYAMRYWFLLLMILIVWRSLWLYLKRQHADNRKKRLLPETDFIGRLVLIGGDTNLTPGIFFPVPKDGTLGSSKGNDVYLNVGNVRKKHLRFHFDEEKGLYVQAARHSVINVDGSDFTVGKNVLMLPGSVLLISGLYLRLELLKAYPDMGRSNYVPTVLLQPQYAIAAQPVYSYPQVAQTESYVLPEENAPAAEEETEAVPPLTEEDYKRIFMPPQRETTYASMPESQMEPFLFDESPVLEDDFSRPGGEQK